MAQHPLASTREETILADKVAKLVLGGRLVAAEDLLKAHGYEDAKQQVDLFAGFIHFMKLYKPIRW